MQEQRRGETMKLGAFFHPIAYQFYFFCVAGLAVALKNVYRTELGLIRSR